MKRILIFNVLEVTSEMCIQFPSPWYCMHMHAQIPMPISGNLSMALYSTASSHLSLPSFNYPAHPTWRQDKKPSLLQGIVSLPCRRGNTFLAQHTVRWLCLLFTHSCRWGSSNRGRLRPHNTRQLEDVMEKCANVNWPFRNGSSDIRLGNSLASAGG